MTVGQADRSTTVRFVNTRAALQRSLVRVTVGVVTASWSLVVLAGSATASSDLFAPPEKGLTVVQTIGLFVLLPAALFAVIALAVMGPSLGRGARHRTGASLDTGPVWIDPANVAAAAQRSGPRPAADGTAGNDRQGGVSAHW